MSLTQQEPLRKDKIRGQKSSLSVVKNQAAKGKQINPYDEGENDLSMRRKGVMRQPFLRPQGAILNNILSLAYSDSQYENDNLVMDGR